MVATKVSIKRARPKKWTERETIRFMELYEAENILWNIHHDLYKNKKARDSAVRRIIKNINIPGISPQDVCRKIHNIRSTYRQERVKIKESMGTDNVYVSTLPWFHIAERFLPSVVKKKSHSNLALDIDETLSVENDTSNEEIIQQISSLDLPPTPSTPDLLPGQAKPQLCSYSRKNKRAKRIEKTMNTLKTLKDVIRTKEVEDEFGYFGKNIACQLRQLPMVDALDCQHEIMILIQQKRKFNALNRNNNHNAVSVGWASSNKEVELVSSYPQESSSNKPDERIAMFPEVQISETMYG